MAVRNVSSEVFQVEEVPDPIDTNRKRLMPLLMNLGSGTWCIRQYENVESAKSARKNLRSQIAQEEWPWTVEIGRLTDGWIGLFVTKP